APRGAAQAPREAFRARLRRLGAARGLGPAPGCGRLGGRARAGGAPEPRPAAERPRRDLGGLRDRRGRGGARRPRGGGQRESAVGARARLPPPRRLELSISRLGGPSARKVVLASLSR